jgi:ABC-2 type transport system ATP-binding protein
MTPVLEFTNVSKNFGSKKALHQLNFRIQKGEFVAFLGPNGAGKSTSISLILGQRRPSAGAIQIFDGKPHEARIKNRIGATPQDLDFPQNLKCREVAQWVAAHYPQSRQIQNRIENLKSKLDLHAFWNRETGGLSGGEKRRLGLLLSLMSNPDILVLDEPTTGMDVNSRRQMWNLMREVHGQGKTILLSTHYLDEVEELSDRVLVIDHGELLFSGTVEEIKRKVDYKMVDVLLLDENLKSHHDIFNWNFKAGRAEFLTRNADGLVKEMVYSNVQFQDLHIRPAKLEDAFMALRSEK